MKAVAVKELKYRLSSYLREVRNGEVVLMTDRGRVVAELRQPSTGTPLSAHDRVRERLCAEGVLVVGLPQDRRAYRPSPLRRAVARGTLLRAGGRGEGHLVVSDADRDTPGRPTRRTRSTHHRGPERRRPGRLRPGGFHLSDPRGLGGDRAPGRRRLPGRARADARRDPPGERAVPPPVVPRPRRRQRRRTRARERRPPGFPGGSRPAMTRPRITARGRGRSIRRRRRRAALELPAADHLGVLVAFATSVLDAALPTGYVFARA